MGTGQEFEDFVQARSAALLRTAYALAGDYGHAEDMVQTVLLRTARRWAAARASPDAYARKVLVNLCRDRTRWMRRRPRESVLANGAGPPGAVEMADRVGQQLSVIQALRRLPAGQRRVVVLRFLEDLPSPRLRICSGFPRDGEVYAARALASLRVILDDTAPAPARGASEVFRAH